MNEKVKEITTMDDPNGISFTLGLFTGGGFALIFTSGRTKHIVIGIIFLLCALALALL